MPLHVVAIKTRNFILANGFVLLLEKTFYVLSFSRNLVLVSRLIPLGFFFNISDKFCKVYCKSNLVGNDTLFDGLFRLNLKNNISYTLMHVHVGIKRCGE